MSLIPFLRDLHDLLTSPDAWHPMACANARGRMLGEFEQQAPSWTRPVATDRVPVAWNLPCAIRYLLDAWEEQGRFLDAPLEKTALRYAAIRTLEDAAGVTDLWLITEHAVAHCALVQALDNFVSGRAA